MNYLALIVDDDEVCLLIHRQIISISGIHDAPLSFSSAEHALTYLKSISSEDVHVLIFLDINMPGMNGWELLDIIHGDLIKAQISVAMVSSSVDDRDKKKAYSYSKVIDFIEKPFNVQSVNNLKEKLRTMTIGE